MPPVKAKYCSLCKDFFENVFAVPKFSPRRKLWLRSLRATGYDGVLTKFQTICDKHFPPGFDKRDHSILPVMDAATQAQPDLGDELSAIGASAPTGLRRRGRPPGGGAGRKNDRSAINRPAMPLRASVHMPARRLLPKFVDRPDDDEAVTVAIREVADRDTARIKERIDRLQAAVDQARMRNKASLAEVAMWKDRLRKLQFWSGQLMEQIAKSRRESNGEHPDVILRGAGGAQDAAGGGDKAGAKHRRTYDPKLKNIDDWVLKINAAYPFLEDSKAKDKNKAGTSGEKATP